MVSITPPRTPVVDVGSGALLRRVRLDSAGSRELRSLLVADMCTGVQRMGDMTVVEEACKRVSGASRGTDQLRDKNKTWVEFELLDKNKRPVKGLRVEVTLPDGTVEKATLSEKGAFRKDGIDPGTCRVRIQELCGREWGKAICFADGALFGFARRLHSEHRGGCGLLVLEDDLG